VTSLLSPTASLVAPTTQTRDDRVGDQPAPDRDPAWQRAFEQAQTAEFAGWFKPWTPPPGAPMQTSLASGDTAMRQSAVAMSIGLSSPSIAPASIRSAASSAAGASQPSLEPSPSADPKRSADPSVAHSIAPEPTPPTPVPTGPTAPPANPSQVFRTLLQSAKPPIGTEPAGPTGPVGGAPSALIPRLPGPATPTLAAGLGTISAGVVPPPAGVPPAVVASARADAVQGGALPNDGSAPGSAAGQAVASALAAVANAPTQNLAASLEAALSVAVTVVSGIAGTAQAGAANVMLSELAGALPLGPASSATTGGAPSTDLAGLPDAAALADEDAEAASPVFEATAPSTTSAETGGEVREPVRLYAEWSDQGVRVWLGTDADQAPRLPILAQQVQQWAAGQGVRLLALVCNGRTMTAEAESTAEPTAQAGDGGAWDGGAELPKPRFVNMSDRF
jgi:hypothetical protein